MITMEAESLVAINEELRDQIEELGLAAEGLRHGEHRYRSLVEATAAIVWTTPASGEFEVEQERWSDFTGQSFQQLKGWGWLEAVHPDDRPHTAQVWSTAVASRSTFHVEHRLLRSDGVYRNMVVRAVPILDESGMIREWVGVHTDVTTQRETEAALREAKAVAESANRAKSEFLANMSHEIRTPMNGILGMTELALDTELTKEQRRYLGMVKTSADALLTVINDILDFSRIEAGKLNLVSVSFSLRDQVGDTMKAMALRAHKKGLELICDICPDVPDALVGDPGRLGQVIINLVGNAIKFTEQGEVVLSVRPGFTTRQEDVQFTMDGASPSSKFLRPGSEFSLRFDVRDTGPGIPKDKQTQLFKPFTQTDNSSTRQYGGTGLGLTISKRLVELMGGQIGLESSPGRGSTFSFTVPFKVEATASHLVLAEPNRLCGASVLVVDDNATNRLILQETLTRWGMKSALADSGMAALDALGKAAQAGRSFDLVLLDVMMPEVDGFQVAEQIHEMPTLVGTRIVMLSSADQQQDTARCQRAGVAAYLVKPVKQSELLEAILTTLGGSLTDAESGRPGRDRHRSSLHPDVRRGLRILLAEDNATNQALAVTLLEREGHSVEVAGNGREALAILARATFDVVLMDIQMPEMDGFEATARVREQERWTGQHQPIIAMTAHALKGDQDRCLESGMDGYVSKPIRVGELFRAIAAAVGQSNLPSRPVLATQPSRRLGSRSSTQPVRSPASAICPPAGPDKTYLLARFGGREDHLRKIVGLFQDDSDFLLDEIRGAIASGKAERLKQSAHALKGAAGLFGSTAVVDEAQRLESMGQANELTEAAETQRRLERELGRLKQTLRNML